MVDTPNRLPKKSWNSAKKKSTITKSNNSYKPMKKNLHTNTINNISVRRRQLWIKALVIKTCIRVLQNRFWVQMKPIGCLLGVHYNYNYRTALQTHYKVCYYVSVRVHLFHFCHVPLWTVFYSCSWFRIHYTVKVFHSLFLCWFHYCCKKHWYNRKLFYSVYHHRTITSIFKF